MLTCARRVKIRRWVIWVRQPSNWQAKDSQCDALPHPPPLISQELILTFDDRQNLEVTKNKLWNERFMRGGSVRCWSRPNLQTVFRQIMHALEEPKKPRNVASPLGLNGSQV